MTPLSLRQSAAQVAPSQLTRNAAAVCSNVAVAAGADCSRDRCIASSILNAARWRPRLYSGPHTLTIGGPLMTASLTVRAALVACTLGFTASALAALAPDFVEKLASEQRPLEDRVRDGARRPYQ